jgi:hypothetical protein
VSKITAYGTSGTDYDFFFFNEENEVWDGMAAFVAWNDANYALYRCAAAEVGATGAFYRDYYPNGSVRWELREQSGTLGGSVVADRGTLTAPIDYDSLVNPQRIAGQDPIVFPTTFLSGNTGGRTFSQTGINATVARQKASITRIRFYTYTAIYEGQIKFLVFRGGVKVAETQLFDVPEGNTPAPRIFDLSTPLLVEQGDHFGVYHICVDNNDTLMGVATSVGSVIKYAAGDLSAEASLTSTTSDFAFLMEFVGEGPELCVTGDSIAEGSGNGAAKFYGHFQDAVAFGGASSSEMGYWVAKLLGNITYQNLAKGNQTFAWVLSTGIPACVAAAPDKILIHCGVNDVNTSRLWSAVESDLDAIRLLVPLTTELFIDEILPWTNGDTDEQALTIRTFNTNLATWCQANSATLILCHDAMGQVRTATGELDDLLADYDQDGVHLTTAGLYALARLQAGAMGNAGQALTLQKTIETNQVAKADQVVEAITGGYELAVKSKGTGTEILPRKRVKQLDGSNLTSFVTQAVGGYVEE